MLGDAKNQSELRDSFRWKKVESPKSWNPKEPSELVGYFIGKTVKSGQHGQYEVVLVAVPGDGIRTVSGVRVIQLVDAALLEYGHPVQIVFKGFVELTGNRKMKDFEVFIRDGHKLPADELPAPEER